MRRRHWISRLIRGLGSYDEEIRADAAERLGGLGLAGQRALPSLIEALSDEDSTVRINVIRALGRIGTDSPEVVMALEELEDSEAEEPRLWVSVALLRLGVRPLEMLTDICMFLLDESPADKQLISEILSEFDPDVLRGFDPKIKHALLGLGFAARQGPKAIHSDMLDILADLGTPTDAVSYAWWPHARGLDSDERIAVVNALGKVGMGSVEIAELLHAYAIEWGYRDTEASQAAIGALGEVSSGTGLSIPALIDILTSWWIWDREWAASLLRYDEDRALSHFEPNPDVISSLIGALADGWVQGEVRSAAEHVLRRTGSLDEETLVELRDAFRDLGARDADLGRFERLGPRSRQLAVAALEELVCTEHCHLALEAARALGRLDPAAAVPLLLTGKYSESPEPRKRDEILDEICARSEPEEILASFRSPGRVLELISLSSRGNLEFKEAARLAVRELCESSEPAEILSACRSRDDLSELVILISFGDQRVKDAARLTVRKTFGDHLVPELVRKLKYATDPDFKNACICLLGKEGRSAAASIPHLIAMLQWEKEPGLRTAILEALVRIGQPDDVILPLWVGLEDPDAGVRSSALSALVSLGPEVGDAIHGIEAVAHNPSEDPALRSAALQFIESMVPYAAAVVRIRTAKHNATSEPQARGSVPCHVLTAVG